MNYLHGLMAVGTVLGGMFLLFGLASVLVIIENKVSESAAYGFLAVVFTGIIFLLGAST